ncbi:MAG: YgiQ family radical SAM protein [Eubacteriales bacterium]|nr:YgiQ family radical SAM protein [Eubacteriales bacterium]
MTPLIPLTRQDMLERGWDELDFLFITGDAYVDHPSFGAALIARLLEQEGFRIGIIAQPALYDPRALLTFGKPRLATLVSSGVVDSMVNNYTAARKPRSDDRYSPGGQGGIRPDRALIRYCNLVRDQLGDVPLIIGGVEASLRRFAHYDYWDHTVRRTILQDTQADLLVYGMGERTILQIARLLEKGVPVHKINKIAGTCILARPDRLPSDLQDFLAAESGFAFSSLGQDKKKLLLHPFPENDAYILLPGYQEVSQDKWLYATAFRMQYHEQAPVDGKTLVQRHSDRYLIQNPPQPPLSTQELDQVFALPYTRKIHPSYIAQGGVPAIEEVRFSINSHRGCYGGCHFCAITFHHGRIVTRRSEASILNEAKTLIADPDFKGYIHDLGGPTANFFEPGCAKQEKGRVCKDRQCITPDPCPALRTDHRSYLGILKKVRSLDGVKKVFIRSGIRFDTVLMDEKSGFLEEVCRHHVSGQLKVAPEHISEGTLRAMGKPGPAVYQRFKKRYEQINAELGKKQFLVPYLISGHPGTSLEDAIELALYIKANRVVPEQVQDFYPTPGTVSTTMYHTGLDPETLNPIHVPDLAEKRLQRALLQYAKPKYHPLALQALQKAGRDDLIGYGPDCLVPPKPYSIKNHSDKAQTKREEKSHDHHDSRQGARRTPAQPAGRKGPGNLRTDGQKTRPGRRPGR